MPHKFAGKVERSTKRARGKTSLEQTPIAIRSDSPLPRGLETRIRTKLARRIGHGAALIERGTVRFEDINGPRGGVDTVCRIKLVISGRPSLQAQERATDAEPAFDLASHKVQRVLERERGKHGLTSGKRRQASAARQHTATTPAPARAKTTRSAAAKTARSAPAKRAHQPPERKPMKLKTARMSPSRAKAKSGASRAKRQHRVQRGARR